MLTEAQLAEIASAARAARSIRRAAAAARISGGTTLAFGALTVLGILWGDVVSFATGAALAAIGAREWRWGGRLAALDERSPRQLAMNQLALGAVIFAYAALSAWGAWNADGLSSASQPVGDAKVDAMLADIGRTTRVIVAAVYACVGVGGMLGTGLMALYYSRRAAKVRAFLVRHPKWIADTMRAAA